MNLVQESIWAWRRLSRRPFSAAGVVVAMTLGVTISVVMFSVLQTVVLRSLPYPDGRLIVDIHAESTAQGVSRAQLTAAEVREVVDGVPGFAATAYYGWGGFTFTGDGAPRLIETVFVSEHYFAVFAVPAALGRTLTASDVVEQTQVVVLSHAAWIDLTGGDPNAIGRTLRFQGFQFDVVGVLPESFAHPGPGVRMYRPIPAVITSGSLPGYRDTRTLSAVGRLAPGVPGELADELLGSRLQAMHDSHGIVDQAEWSLRQVRMIDGLIGRVRDTLFALFGVSILVLIVACSTVTSLVSINLARRRSELALRHSLGASRARIALDLALELVLLALMAGAGVLALGSLALAGLAPLMAESLPRGGVIDIDGATLTFAAIATLGSLFLSGALALRRAFTVEPVAALRRGHGIAARGRPASTMLPAIGIGLSSAALVIAFALTASLSRLGDVDPGYRTDAIAALQVFRALPDVARFTERSFEALLEVPGVRDVAAVRSPPLDSGGRFAMNVVAQRALTTPIPADVQRASAGYHSFLEIPLIRGRDLSSEDSADAPRVAVINETLARRLFGTMDSIGQPVVVSIDGAETSFEVVGVAADTRNAGLRAPTNPELIIPLAQFEEWPFSVTLLVESAMPPSAIMHQLREAVWRVDPNQAINREFTLADDFEAQTREARFFSRATLWFAVLAMLLGAAGVNAVIASTQQRLIKEIGLRIALGASPAQAATLVLANAGRIVVLGLTIGALLAVPALGWLRAEMFEVEAATLAALFGLTALTLTFIAMTAAAWPAWQASRIGAMEALRAD